MQQFSILQFRMPATALVCLVLLVSGCNSGDPFEEPVPRGLSVAEVTPAEKAVNVAVDTSVLVRFAAPVDPQSLSSNHVILSRKRSGTTVSGKIDYNAESVEVRFEPYSPLKPGETYELVLNQIQGAQGEFLAPHVFEFTTAELFETVEMIPTPDASGIAVTGSQRQDIAVRFSQSLDVSQMSSEDYFAWEQAEGDSLATTLEAQIVWSESDRTLSLKPRNGRLKYAHTYHVILRRARSLSGSEAEPAEWMFTTEEPSISGITPSQGAIDVATDEPLSISFPLPVDRSTVPGSILLREALGVQREFTFARPFTYQENSGTIVTLPVGADEQSHLSRNTRYEILVDGVESTASEKFKRSLTWFETTSQ